MITTIERHFSAFKGELNKYYQFFPGYRFLDLTLGDGGHTEEALLAGCQVVSFDVDPEAIERATQYLKEKFTPLIISDYSSYKAETSLSDTQWIIIQSNFNNATEAINALRIPVFDGVMIDLGPSQYQVLNPERGFSFNSDAQLDMRLDKNLAVTAKDLINGLNEGELRDLFELGDEPFSRPIARIIAKKRQENPINTCKQLSDLVARVKTKVHSSTNPATQVFMTLRMAVNLERETIHTVIQEIPKVLKASGIIGIISFHSTEDKLVKQELSFLEEKQIVSAINKKPFEPSLEELKISNRTRSAKLRLVKKNI